MPNKMMQLTVFKAPSFSIQTTKYGIISWKQWIDHEIDRFISHGRLAEIIEDKKTGMIALNVDRIAI